MYAPAEADDKDIDDDDVDDKDVMARTDSAVSLTAPPPTFERDESDRSEVASLALALLCTSGDHAAYQ